MTSGTSPRSPFLVVLDVDSTLIEDEVIELIADYAGVTDEVAEVTGRAMAGELNFEESLRHRVALLEGVSSTDVASVVDRVVVTDGVPELIDGVHAAGGSIAAVSGGFHEILDELAERLGLDRWRANRFEVVDGKLTGKVSGPIIGSEAKRETLLEWAHELGIDLSRTVAIGDGANDLGMMSAAGLSIAFDAKPVVREQAHVSLPDRDMRQVLAALGLEG
ncbi:phosphoserine phosphatase SerB [Pseudoclavibacter sp. VKM Ac-2888]|uniref:phosphoserine phosphatase SerB n=1 Tax=Pseudoclavibacter sp. VKM Ac-2888 TaxID=2783830 RepID=UPI00188D4520|nr:phosphoserine phosphatase SerB [Pseudoclavibacter sp. VKM Ac-2888]MBF4549011.1 phosphoserine phosphatase SerB [Pseudoclavibacter sp. VKM Ac-2888]